MWRVINPQNDCLLFPGGFLRQADAEWWALGRWIRGVIGDYVVIRL